MYQPPGVMTSAEFPIPDRMKAWVLCDPDQLKLREKPVPVPSRAEVLIWIDAVAICATDLEIIHSGSPANIEGGMLFNNNFTPGERVEDAIKVVVTNRQVDAVADAAAE